jgi:hypothetical protein
VIPVVCAALAFGLGWLLAVALTTDNNPIKVKETFTGQVKMVSQDHSKICVLPDTDSQARCGRPYQLASTPAPNVGDRVSITIETVSDSAGNSEEIYLTFPTTP